MTGPLDHDAIIKNTILREKYLESYLVFLMALTKLKALDRTQLTNIGDELLFTSVALPLVRRMADAVGTDISSDPQTFIDGLTFRRVQDAGAKFSRSEFGNAVVGDQILIRKDDEAGLLKIRGQQIFSDSAAKVFLRHAVLQTGNHSLVKKLMDENIGYTVFKDKDAEPFERLNQVAISKKPRAVEQALFDCASAYLLAANELHGMPETIGTVGYRFMVDMVKHVEMVTRRAAALLMQVSPSNTSGLNVQDLEGTHAGKRMLDDYMEMVLATTSKAIDVPDHTRAAGRT